MDDKMIPYHDAQCSYCGKLIEKGTLCYWVSSTDVKPSGLFHLECYDKMDSKTVQQNIKGNNDGLGNANT